MDSVVDELSGQDGTRVDESKEILRVLIAAGVTSTLDYLVLVHRNIEVRLALLLLLLKNRDQSDRD